jgi:lipopolysaccharide export system permease protein
MKVTPDETAMEMVLYNGYSYKEMPDKNEGGASRKFPFRKDTFKKQTIVVSLSGFDLERTEIDLFKSNSSMKNISQLTHDIDSLNRRYTTRIDEHLKEFNQTFLYTVKPSLKKVITPSDSSTAKALADFNVNAVYDSLTVQEKRIVIGKALSQVRQGNSYLTTQNKALHNDVKFIKGYEISWNEKFTMAFACIVFFLIGAPLGAIIRKGGLGTPAVISVLFFVIWYVVSITGKKLVEEDLVGTIAGMWASSYILLPIGIFLTYKASTDSAIMNIETYLSFLRKIKDNLYRVIIIGNRRNPAFEENKQL